MNKHVKRIPIYLILAIVVIFLAVWGAALLRCEILTGRYHDDFAEAYKSNKMIGDMDYFKVLSCDGENAEVYYVSALGAALLEFELQDGAWVETAWDMVWSKSGSADGIVWPYWWHVITYCLLT